MILRPKAVIVLQKETLEDDEYCVVYNSENEIIYTTGKYSNGSKAEAEKWCRENGYRY